MNARKTCNRTTSPKDEASIQTNPNELEKHRRLIHAMMNELRSAVQPLLLRLPACERNELIRPLARSLAGVVAAFSLETTPAVNGELAQQLEVGAEVLGQLAQRIDWAADLGYLTREEHGRISWRMRGLLLGGQNLRWFLTGHPPEGIHRGSRASLGAIKVEG
jgi:hypothetical protein